MAYLSSDWAKEVEGLEARVVELQALLKAAHPWIKWVAASLSRDPIRCSVEKLVDEIAEALAPRGAAGEEEG